MKILDNAFGLAKNAYGANGHAEAKDRLQAMYPKLTWDEIVKAYLNAYALAEACYGYGEECRNKIKTDGEAILEMSIRKNRDTSLFFIDI